MPDNKQKKLHNRFDEWEVLSIFVETTEEFLSKNHSSVNRKLLIRSILGILMAINAYLSHFGPWTWPHNYYFLIFSVIFYFGASTYYAKLGDIQASEGNKVGEYIVKGYKRIYLFKLTPEKIEYVLEEVDSETKEVTRRKSFNYLQYFTENGDFLESQFLKHLDGFMKNTRS